MRYLFVHQNFPGQYQHLINDILARKAGDEILFISEPNKSQITGVRRVNYRMPPLKSRNVFEPIQEQEVVQIRAAEVARVAQSVKSLGFQPDVIIGHHGWGELLNIEDVFPGVPLIGYFEFFYHIHGIDVGFDPEFPMEAARHSRVRNKNITNLLALNNAGFGQTPTAWQHSTYPQWAHDKIRIIPDGVNLDVCKPNPGAFKTELSIGNLTVAPDEKLLTFVSRDLEPYRGYHVLVRALPQLLRERPDLRVALVGGDGVSYGARPSQGTWREFFFNEVRDHIDVSRVHFMGKLPYEDYVRLLQRSDTHVYLTYPFVASWSLREAMAMGCVVVGADTPTVTEFVTHRKTGLLTPCLDSARLADTVLEALQDTKLAKRLRTAARKYATENFPMARHLESFYALIKEVTGAAPL